MFSGNSACVQCILSYMFRDVAKLSPDFYYYFNLVEPAQLWLPRTQVKLISLQPQAIWRKSGFLSVFKWEQELTPYQKRIGVRRL